ncbi:hypothetical protein HUJ04_011215 [Dendroctonus ponderosae]|nr:hypothetical protein HUJ04_011215 [Dendroctonus ponderosae]
MITHKNNFIIKTNDEFNKTEALELLKHQEVVTSFKMQLNASNPPIITNVNRSVRPSFSVVTTGVDLNIIDVMFRNCIKKIHPQIRFCKRIISGQRGTPTLMMRLITGDHATYESLMTDDLPYSGKQTTCTHPCTLQSPLPAKCVTCNSDDHAAWSMKCPKRPTAPIEGIPNVKVKCLNKRTAEVSGSMDSKTKYYTLREKALLVQLVKENEVIENKKTDSVSTQEKNDAWKKLQKISGTDPDGGGQANAKLKNMKEFNFVFDLLLLRRGLAQCEILSKSLQSSSVTYEVVKSVKNRTLEVLQSFRTDDFSQCSSINAQKSLTSADLKPLRCQEKSWNKTQGSGSKAVAADQLVAQTANRLQCSDSRGFGLGIGLLPGSRDEVTITPPNSHGIGLAKRCKAGEKPSQKRLTLRQQAHLIVSALPTHAGLCVDGPNLSLTNRGNDGEENTTIIHHKIPAGPPQKKRRAPQLAKYRRVVKNSRGPPGGKTTKTVLGRPSGEPAHPKKAAMTGSQKRHRSDGSTPNKPAPGRLYVGTSVSEETTHKSCKVAVSGIKMAIAAVGYPKKNFSSAGRTLKEAPAWENQRAAARDDCQTRDNDGVKYEGTIGQK